MRERPHQGSRDGAASGPSAQHAATRLARDRAKLRRKIARLDKLITSVDVRSPSRADWGATADAVFLDRELRPLLIKFANVVGWRAEAR